MANNPPLERIYPFFIVKNLAVSIDFYNQKLGFETDLLIPEEDPFFGIVSRDNVKIFLKHITEFIHPVPNHIRHEWARWDAFIFTPDPTRCFLSISRVDWNSTSPSQTPTTVSALLNLRIMTGMFCVLGNRFK